MGYQQFPSGSTADNRWALSGTAAAAAAVTVTKAGAAGVQHVLRRVQVTATPGSAVTAATGLIIVLDGVTLIAQWVVTYAPTPATAQGPGVNQLLLDVDNLFLVGTAGNLLTVTTAALNTIVAAATPAGVSAGINAFGYDIP